ncbi:hypothetical protein [Limnohabitans sp. 2KL-51]|uniref:hypothetical protein n=1 Tax=Limnohabitans sp. 2KL-51 TaxID=1977911 RepID=UPI0011B23AB2|nr:hypothetical protein [Limnohabitans sp. 2KL-51]
MAKTDSRKSRFDGLVMTAKTDTPSQGAQTKVPDEQTLYGMPQQAFSPVEREFSDQTGRDD